jgi:hypothetical protein
MPDSKKIAPRAEGHPAAVSNTSSISNSLTHSIAMGAGLSLGQRLVNGAMCMLEQGPPKVDKEANETLEQRVKRCEPFKTEMDNCMKYNTAEVPCYEELRGYMYCINTPPLYTKKNTPLQ